MIENKKLKEKILELKRKRPDLNFNEISQELNCDPSWVGKILRCEKSNGCPIPLGDEYKEYSKTKIFALEEEIKSLKNEVKKYKQDIVTSTQIRELIFDLKSSKPNIPNWALSTQNPQDIHGVIGIPSTVWSDFHWEEHVDPSQVMDLNEFNMKIAHDRFRTLIEGTVDLLKNHMVNPNYPGFVLNLAGDFFSHDIHDELALTNECHIMPAVIDLLSKMIWGINILADNFNNILINGVVGNHPRTTKKIWSKDKAFTNFDWLLYSLLEMHFKNDERIHFNIADGDELQYKIYNHRYRLTHGDQFKGGDGIIGSIGPVFRGDTKKRAWSQQAGLEYETLILGHFHQLRIDKRIIQNGSLIGYNQFAKKNNFPLEYPEQALWITHPHRGITFYTPIQVVKPNKTTNEHWCSIFK